MVVKALPWPAGSLIRTWSRTRYTPVIFCSASSWLTSCQIPAIANFYMTVYGDEEDANVTSSQCSPRANKMWANQADGGSLRFAIPSLQDPADRPTCRERTLELATSCPPSPAQGPGELMMIVSHRCSHRCTRCSDCPNRHCVNCPDKETRCKDCKTKCSRARQDLMVLNIS